jgi:phospholipid/cholesterol/gamma-HCH transport system substrate-binding protein
MRRLALIATTLAAGIGLLLATSATSDDGGPYEVRAIFDNASFLVTGEEVRVAGAKVGEVTEVDVTRPGEAVSDEPDIRDDPGKAAVVMEITEAGFQDFREDASCIIQPQSLLGEKFVGCSPTQPRAAGTAPPPPLQEVPEGQPGEGQRLLPLENNGKAVDLDLVNNIMREPYAERFRLILNDLGAGFAARGDELDEIVERANPALRQTDRVLAILAEQNRALAELARDSDTVLAPLARERRGVAGFINNANTTAQATAQRSADLEAGLERFPGYLRELRPTMVELRRLSDQATPVISDFGNAAPALTRAQRALGPLAEAATPALVTLGNAAEASVGDIVASDPVIKDVRDLANAAQPGAKQLNRLLSSLERGICVQRDTVTGQCMRETDGFRSLMDFIFNTSASVNGFDEFGHYLRTFALITNCTRIISTPVGGCSANFTGAEEAGTSSGAGLLDQLGAGEGARKRKPRGGQGTLTPRPGGETRPLPAPAEPQPEAAPEPQGDPGELSPAPDATQSPPSLRGGRELLRFLMGNGS